MDPGVAERLDGDTFVALDDVAVKGLKGILLPFNLNLEIHLKFLIVLHFQEAREGEAEKGALNLIHQPLQATEMIYPPSGSE